MDLSQFKTRAERRVGAESHRVYSVRRVVRRFVWWSGFVGLLARDVAYPSTVVATCGRRTRNGCGLTARSVDIGIERSRRRLDGGLCRDRRDGDLFEPARTHGIPGGRAAGSAGNRRDRT